MTTPHAISATTPLGSTLSSTAGSSIYEERQREIESLSAATAEEKRAFLANWSKNAEPPQLPPDGDWTTWLFMGGRGAGKTRAGAEWVRALVLGRKVLEGDRVERIALVGETLADV